LLLIGLNVSGQSHLSLSPLKSRINWAQFVWGLGCLSLLFGTALALLHGSKHLADIAVPLGFCMLCAGITNMIIYHWQHRILHGSRWILADGLTAVLLSGFLLFNDLTQAALIPFFFGMWELFSGILYFIDSKELREGALWGWNLFRIVGIIEMVFGFASLLKPVDEFVGMHGVVALVLLVKASGFLLKILIYPHLVEANKK